MPLPTTQSQNSLSNTIVAFDMLMEEIETVLNSINKAGASAFEANDYDEVNRAMENALGIKTLYQDISGLKEEWINRVLHVYEAPKTSRLTSTKPQKMALVHTFKRKTINHNKAPAAANRLITGRISKGLRTQESVFFCPILQALSVLGGSAKRRQVFELIEQSMQSILKPIDYQILSSDHGQLRWQNSAQWARNLMIKEGLLRADSSQGIWEITEKGRAFLKENLH